MRDVRLAVEQGDQHALEALDVFRHRLLQLLGSMAASLGGVDMLALTGGIGENDLELQKELGGIHYLRDSLRFPKGFFTIPKRFLKISIIPKGFWEIS